MPVAFVVDPDDLVHDSLDPLVRRQGCRLKAFRSAEEFLASTPESVPSFLLVEVFLPGLGGLELQKHLGRERPEIPIVFLSSEGDTATIVRAIKGGAIEFLTKPLGTDVTAAALAAALERSQASWEAASETRVLQQCCQSLSGREREVMGLVVSGLMNKQIGYELGISEITVKAHRGRVMRKMRARSLAELVRIAARLEISGPAPGRQMPAPHTNRLKDCFL